MNYYLRFRNGRHRLALLLAVIFGTLLLVFVMHSTHGKMVGLQERAVDCEQKQESLSAQLQVFIEHKGRLEKGLQQEKLNHKQTKDKLEAQYEELQELLEKEKSEAATKYSALQQQFKRLQDKSEDQVMTLQEDLKRSQDLYKELAEKQLSEVSKINSQMDAVKLAKDSQISELQAELEKVRGDSSALLKRSSLDQFELQSCHKKLESVSKSTLSSDSVGRRPSPSDIDAQKVPLMAGRNLDNSVGNSLPRKFSPSNVVSKTLDLPSHDEIVGNVGPPPNINIDNPVAAAKNKPDDTNQDLGIHQIPQPDDDNNVEPAVEAKPHVDPVMEHNLGKPQVGAQQLNMFANRNRPEGANDEQELRVGKELGAGADGLEQQENGEDQDLDNMDNDVGAGKKVGNPQFDDADFDQPADQVDNEDVNIAGHNDAVRQQVAANN